MAERLEVAWILVILLGALAVLAWEQRWPERSPETRARVLAGLAIAALAGWIPFGMLHRYGQFVQVWDQYHYQLGGKYFRELGYDGLYVASLEAQVESEPDLGVPGKMRDCRDDSVVDARTLRPHAEEVAARFTPERWADFVRDDAEFRRLVVATYRREGLVQVRLDHGFNASPAWVAESRVFGGGVAVSAGSLAMLGFVDVALALAALVAILRWHGARAACLVAIIGCTVHAWSFYWIGGAFLRLDWVIAIALAACAAKAGRPGLAGGLLGWAALMKIFPVVFLLGPAVAWISAVLGRRPAREAARVLVGAAVAVVVGLVAGSLVGRGPGAWIEFVQKIRRHEAVELTIGIGARKALACVTDGALAPGLLRIAWLILAAVFLVLAVRASRRLTLHESIVIGIVPAFAMASLACYYWLMLALVPLVRGRFMVASAIAIGLASLPLRTVDEGLEFSLLSVGLGAAVVVWLVLLPGGTSRPEASMAPKGG